MSLQTVDNYYYYYFSFFSSNATSFMPPFITLDNEKILFGRAIIIMNNALKININSDVRIN